MTHPTTKYGPLGAHIHYLDLVDDNFDIKHSVEVGHGVSGVKHHQLSHDFVDLAGAQGSYGPVRTPSQTQLLVRSNTSKNLERKKI